MSTQSYISFSAIPTEEVFLLLQTAVAEAVNNMSQSQLQTLVTSDLSDFNSVQQQLAA